MSEAQNWADDVYKIFLEGIRIVSFVSPIWAGKSSQANETCLLLSITSPN
jgi:hypothetical protein